MKDCKFAQPDLEAEIIKRLRFNDYRLRSARKKALDEAIIKLEMINAELRFLDAKRR